MLFAASSNCLFNQMEALLLQLTPAEYGQSLPAFSGGTIGQHLRHVLEFYSCLLAGAHTGLVNYEARARELALEQDPAAALARLHAIEEGFAAHSSEHPLRLQATFGRQAPLLAEVGTTLEREIVYLAEHTVHHLAIVAIALRTHLPHIAIPESFGVAESTLRARDRQLAAAAVTATETCR